MANSKFIYKVQNLVATATHAVAGEAERETTGQCYPENLEDWLYLRDLAETLVKTINRHTDKL